MKKALLFFLRRPVGIPAACLLCLVIAAGPARAVVQGRSDTADFNDPRSPWYGMNWDYVYRLKSLSAVAVGYFSLLTAAHAEVSAGHVLKIAGDRFEVVSERLLVPPPGESRWPDLAVVRLRNTTNPLRPLPGFYRLDGDVLPARSDLLLVGWGRTGKLYDDYYAEDPDSRRMKRWGAARFYGRLYDVPAGEHFRMKVLEMPFVDDDLPDRAGLAKGDSGGGAFIRSPGGDGWLLAGINLYRRTLGFTDGGWIKADLMYAAYLPVYAEQVNVLLADDRLPGDLDLDGSVDAADYVALKRSRGGRPAGDWAKDLLAIDTNLGYRSIPHGGVPAPPGPCDQPLGGQRLPEPTALGILAAAMAGVLARRRGRRAAPHRPAGERRPENRAHSA